VAELYWGRFSRADDYRQRIERVHLDGVARLNVESSVWLALSVMPATLGDFELSQQALNRIHNDWFPDVARQLFPADYDTTLEHWRTAFRRIAAGQPDPANPHRLVEVGYAELHRDGSGFAAAEVARTSPSEDVVPIRLADLVGTSAAMLGLLARHSTDNARTGGDGTIRAEVVEPGRGDTPPWRAMRLSGSGPMGETFYPGGVPAMVVPAVDRTLDLATAGTASGTLEVVRTLIADLATAFGLPELPHLRADGSVDLAAFPEQDRRRLFKWSERNGVPMRFGNASTADPATMYG
jgi:hypothetical protein